MKKLTVILLCVVFLLCATAGCTPGDTVASTATGEKAGNAQPQGDDALSVGFSRVDITPELDVRQGYLSQLWDAERIESPLRLSCIAITDKLDNTILLITADANVMDSNLLLDIYGRIYDELGVPMPNVIVSTTDTMFAPSLFVGDEPSVAYKNMFADQCVEACRLAMADRSEAEMYTGTTSIDGLNFINDTIQTNGVYLGRGYTQDWRINLKSFISTPDNEIQLLRFARSCGKDIVMMNWRGAPHTYHKTAIDDTAISAGYVRYCVGEAEKKMDCHVAFYQGACGNVDDYSYILGAGKARSHIQMGKMLAQQAMSILPELKKVNSNIIEIKSVDYRGNIRLDSEEYIEAARLYWNTVAYGGEAWEAVAATGGMCRTLAANIGVKQRQSAYKRNEGKYELPLTAISIGDVAFINTPNYMFDNTGKQIKDASPFQQTFILNTVAMDSASNLPYLVSEPAYTYGNEQKELSYFVKGTAEEVAGVYTDMLKQLYQDEMPDGCITTFDSKLSNDT